MKVKQKLNPPDCNGDAPDGTADAIDLRGTQQPATEPESTKPEVTLATVSDKAMELLARREHSRAELKEKLKRRAYDYPAEFIEAVLDDFAARNLQSDERFAEVYVRSRISRGYGEIRIRAELQSRGVSAVTTQLALEALEIDWYGNALAALTKKFASGLNVENLNAENMRSQKTRGKMQRFLQNRGYNPDQIITSINRIAGVVDSNTEASQ